MRLRTLLAALPILAAPAGAAFATDYYVAPPGTVLSCTANGSQACPWTSLWTALNSTKFAGGDRFLLLDGDHGALTLYNFAFAGPVVVQSLNGTNAHLEWIKATDGTKNITFRNLKIWQSDQSTKVSPLVTANSKTSGIVLDGLDVRSTPNSPTDYMSWSLTDWPAKGSSGAVLSGPSSIIQNSSFTGVYLGAEVDGANSALLNNRVDGHAGDAYRALGDYTLVSGNHSQNCFQVDGNHADALQSWKTTTAVYGMTVENNTFIEWNSPVANSLRCSLQGIGFFDGPFQDLVIRNNVVSVTQYHGISVYGGINVKILNNTVVNNKGIEGTSPWIGIFNNKNGTPGQNILVANNLEMSIHNEVTGTAVTLINNSSLMGLTTIFQNIAAFDYRPTPTSGFIDTGDAATAPPADILGLARPTGAGPDRGAYEIGGTGGDTGGSTGGSTGGGTTVGNGAIKAWVVGKFLKPPTKP